MENVMRYAMEYLREAGLVHEKGSTCLDVGARDGKYSRKLAEMGYQVLAVDINPMMDVPPGVEFTRADIQTFAPGYTFDLVFARNILPFTREPLKVLLQLKGMLKQGGVLLVSLFGPEEQWAKEGRAKAVEYEAAVNVLQGLEILYASTTRKYAPTGAGEHKSWHIHDFVARKQN